MLCCAFIVASSFIHFTDSCLALQFSGSHIAMDLSDSSCNSGYFMDMRLSGPEGRSRNSGDNINITAGSREKFYSIPVVIASA